MGNPENDVKTEVKPDVKSDAKTPSAGAIQVLSPEQLEKLFPGYQYPVRRKGAWPWAQMKLGEVRVFEPHEAKKAQRAVHTYMATSGTEKVFRTKLDRTTGKMMVVCLPNLERELALSDIPNLEEDAPSPPALRIAPIPSPFE